MASTYVCTDAFGEDLICEFDYRVTYPGHRSYFDPITGIGDPGGAMEYEVTLTALRRDLPKPDVSNYASPDLAARRLAEWAKRAAPIPLTPELIEVIEDWLMDSQQAYDAIVDDDDRREA